MHSNSKYESGKDTDGNEISGEEIRLMNHGDLTLKGGKFGSLLEGNGSMGFNNLYYSGGTYMLGVDYDGGNDRGDDDGDDDDDDDDEDGGEATLSEQNLYRRLSEYYDLLEDLDSQVRGCAQNFNGNYLEEDRTTRQNLADVAERTEDTIEQYYDIVEDLDVPTSSKNYSSWKDIIALYDDLDHRIDAICDAWEISLKYAKPADHKNEICLL